MSCQPQYHQQDLPDLFALRLDSGEEQPALDGDQARGYLSKLHPYQSRGVEGLHPRVLRECFFHQEVLVGYDPSKKCTQTL